MEPGRLPGFCSGGFDGKDKPEIKLSSGLEGQILNLSETLPIHSLCGGDGVVEGALVRRRSLKNCRPGRSSRCGFNLDWTGLDAASANLILKSSLSRQKWIP